METAKSLYTITNSRTLTKEEIEERKRKVLISIRKDGLKDAGSKNNNEEESKLPWAKKNGIEMSDLSPEEIEANRRGKIKDAPRRIYEKESQKGGKNNPSIVSNPIKGNGKTNHDAPLKGSENLREILGKLRAYEDKLDNKIGYKVMPYLECLDYYTKVLSDKTGKFFKRIPGGKRIKIGGLLAIIGLTALGIATVATNDKASKYLEGIVTNSDKASYTQSPERVQIPNHSKLEQAAVMSIQTSKVATSAYLPVVDIPIRDANIKVEKGEKEIEGFYIEKGGKVPIPVEEYFKGLGPKKSIEALKMRLDIEEKIIDGNPNRGYLENLLSYLKNF